MNELNLYIKIFSIVCGKKSNWLDRNEQVLNGFWLLSMLQGVNMLSIVFIISGFNELGRFPKSISWICFIIPLLINYLILLRHDRKRLIKTIDSFIEGFRWNTRLIMFFYLTFTVAFFVISAVQYGNQ